MSLTRFGLASPRRASILPAFSAARMARATSRSRQMRCIASGSASNLGLVPQFFAERAMKTRREVLAATAAALAMPRVAFAQGEPPKPKQLIFNASGGSQIASLRENYLNDFEKQTGIKIVDTSPVDFGKLRAMVESGNVVLEHHRDRRSGRLPRHRNGPCRADRRQDRRPQQIPAAGADEPRVLAELLFHRDVLSARMRFPRARRNHGRISGT